MRDRIWVCSTKKSVPSTKSNASVSITQNRWQCSLIPWARPPHSPHNCPSTMGTAAVGMMFFTSPRGKIFLATIDIVAPVSSTPNRGLRVPPWCRIGVLSGLIRVLVLVRPAIRASSSTFALATLAFAMPFGLALATILVRVALATALAAAGLALELLRKALLVVALSIVVLPLTTEVHRSLCTCRGAASWRCCQCWSSASSPGQRTSSADHSQGHEAGNPPHFWHHTRREPVHSS